MAISQPWITVLAGMGGTLIGGAIAFITNWMNNRAQHQKHLQALIMQAAIADWDRTFDVAKEISKAGKRVEIPPLDIYLIRNSRLIKVLLDNYELSDQDLLKELQKVDKLTKTIYEFYKNK